jgi:hypothetical protein
MASVAAMIAPANPVMPQKSGPQPMLLIETVTLKLKISDNQRNAVMSLGWWSA